MVIDLVLSFSKYDMASDSWQNIRTLSKKNGKAKVSLSIAIDSNFFCKGNSVVYRCPLSKVPAVEQLQLAYRMLASYRFFWEETTREGRGQADHLLTPGLFLSCSSKVRYEWNGKYSHDNLYRRRFHSAILASFL